MSQQHALFGLKSLLRCTCAHLRHLPTSSSQHVHNRALHVANYSVVCKGANLHMLNSADVGWQRRRFINK